MQQRFSKLESFFEMKYDIMNFVSTRSLELLESFFEMKYDIIKFQKHTNVH